MECNPGAPEAGATVRARVEGDEPTCPVAETVYEGMPVGSATMMERAVVPRARRDSIRRRLLRWYDRHRRDLPWRRRQRDPYAQWVAEIMLQQTRVETVLDYYGRFLRRFPTIRELADADHQVVLKQWEGLGYYRRILHFHRAAQSVRDAGGVIPTTAAGLLSLPGVGDYTAAAIASIAFGEPVAAVDGNVARVLARLFAFDADIRTTETRKRIRRVAESLLSPSRPGDFNQAWMDLGSGVCTPKSPHCAACPLVSHCQGAAAGRANQLPVAGVKGKPKKQTSAVGIFTRGDKMLLRRRCEGGLWSGLWEFPTIVSDGPLPPPETRTRSRSGGEGRVRIDPSGLRLVDRLLTEESLTPVGDPQKVGVVRHELTHRSLSFHVYAVRVRSAPRSRERADRRWVTARTFGELPVSTAHRRTHAVFADWSARGKG